MIMHPDEPAFPVVGEPVDRSAAGLTKREYFAALAMQGFASDPTDHARDYLDAAAAAVLWADALIAALNEEPQP